jgi:hypothetical protein
MYIVPFALLFGIIIGSYYFKEISANSRIFLFYMMASLTIDRIAIILENTTKNNLILFSLLSIVEIITFSLVYYSFIQAKKFVLVLAILGVTYILIEIALINPKHLASFQSYSKIVSSFLIVLMGLKYIVDQIKKEIAVSNQNLHFIIISYFSLELILLLPLNFLINETSNVVFYIWYLRLSVNLLFYIYLIRFIWKNGITQKQLHSGL